MLLLGVAGSTPSYYIPISLDLWPTNPAQFSEASWSVYASRYPRVALQTLWAYPLPSLSFASGRLYKRASVHYISLALSMLRLDFTRAIEYQTNPPPFSR
jgi:hypothetical protein